jgi:hypothetical protein
MLITVTHTHTHTHEHSHYWSSCWINISVQLKALSRLTYREMILLYTQKLCDTDTVSNTARHQSNHPVPAKNITNAFLTEKKTKIQPSFTVMHKIPRIPCQNLCESGKSLWMERYLHWQHIQPDSLSACHMKAEHRQSSHRNQGQSVLADKYPTHLGYHKKHVPSRPHARFLRNTENETECITLHFVTKPKGLWIQSEENGGEAIMTSPQLWQTILKD